MPSKASTIVSERSWRTTMRDDQFARLARVLGMLGSAHDGEVLAAARQAERSVASWIFCGLTSSSPGRTSRSMSSLGGGASRRRSPKGPSPARTSPRY
jgi:hypothetical protein